jgi:hypothetical protein
MKESFILKLNNEQKAKILEVFINRIHTKTKRDGGFILGSNQILDRLEDIAIEEKYVKCPYCGHKDDF